MSWKIGAAVFVAVILAGSDAMAVQLTNRDQREHRVTITEDDISHEVTVGPSETTDGLCNIGCTMRLDGDQPYTLEGTETVSIENGLIFLDDPGQ